MDSHAAFRSLDHAELAGRRVLVRLDLNVPMKNGAVTDMTRIDRSLPTLKELIERGARIIIMAHFGRPDGQVKPEYSLRPLVPVLTKSLGQPVQFAEDCIGPKARSAIDDLRVGEVLLLENIRFHAGEEKNDISFAKELAALGDVYVNDAFSCAHRAHASTEAIAHLLPSYAGRAMEAELTYLDRALGQRQGKITALVGGAKVSTKLDLLENLVTKVDHLIIGGGMANTFLFAQGVAIGTSLAERDMADTAKKILSRAKEAGCTILLPSDAVVADKLAAGVVSSLVDIAAVPDNQAILDIGPQTVAAIEQVVKQSDIIVWNGPLGAFEVAPFDQGTVAVARIVAAESKAGRITSVAGGGDTVAALSHAHVAEDFTYVSTAGGAFLEWLEGKSLPGVEALRG